MKNFCARTLTFLSFIPEGPSRPVVALQERLFVYLLIISTLTLPACSKPISENGTSRTVKLTLFVNNMEENGDSRRDTRTGTLPPDFEDAENKKEMIHSLRIIIVRPDATVEHNTSINPTVVTDFYSCSYDIAPNEKKRIYLIANEDAVGEPAAAFPFLYTLPGEKFDFTGAEQACIGSKGGEMATGSSLPMTAYYEVDVLDQDLEKDLWLLRGAVKLTCQIQNMSSRDICLEEMVFGPVAQRAYFFAHKTPTLLYRNIDGIAWKIDSFAVPSYAAPGSTWEKSFVLPQGNGKIIPAYQGKANLSPYYLLESRLDRNTGKQEYAISLKVDGKIYTSNISLMEGLLVRNTHLIINILFKDKNCTFQTDVIPYTGFFLEPDFGI